MATTWRRSCLDEIKLVAPFQCFSGSLEFTSKRWSKKRAIAAIGKEAFVDTCTCIWMVFPVTVVLP